MLKAQRNDDIWKVAALHNFKFETPTNTVTLFDLGSNNKPQSEWIVSVIFEGAFHHKQYI
jgi:hypothetical protein